MEKINPEEIQHPRMMKIKSGKGDFKCECGDEIDQEFLSIHINDCNVMQDQYGELYNSLNVLIEDSPFPKTMNNIQAITIFFKNKLQRILEKVNIYKRIFHWFLSKLLIKNLIGFSSERLKLDFIG